MSCLDLDKKQIIAVTMPCFGTTDRTYQNACKMTVKLGATLKEVPIADAVNIHFRDIGQDPENHDVTYENSQARERTQVLMDIANAAWRHGDRNRRYVRTGTWAGQLTTGIICPCMESMRLFRKHW